MACETCMFFERTNVRPLKGICRRNPPQAALNHFDAPCAIWPDVSGSDWCGEHATVTDDAGGN